MSTLSCKFCPTKLTSLISSKDFTSETPEETGVEITLAPPNETKVKSEMCSKCYRKYFRPANPGP